MAALLLFIVFLAAIAIAVPIAVSMILGAAAPILLLEQGGSITQLLNNTFSGANSTPILAFSSAITIFVILSSSFLLILA